LTGEPFDTRVTNGRFVDSHGPARSALTINDGRVVEDGDEHDVWRTVNASRHLVLPGMIQPGDPWQDAALDLVRGGVTTIVRSDTEEQSGDAACIDYVRSATIPIRTVEISSPDGLLPDSDWELILGNDPIHVSVSMLPSFPIIQFLYHEGHAERGLTIERIVDVTATAIAQSLSVYPRKAGFSGGSDGDLYVFDPETPDPYRDHPWPGRVIFSLQRGNILLYNGQIHTNPGDGMEVGRSCHAG
jgi:hypothetical protein